MSLRSSGLQELEPSLRLRPAGRGGPAWSNEDDRFAIEIDAKALAAIHAFRRGAIRVGRRAKCATYISPPLPVSSHPPRILMPLSAGREFLAIRSEERRAGKGR